jgi:DNA-binding transcriptional MerR regulator
MQIGELSKVTGISVRMLRYYEAQSLLKPIRTAAGYRTYEQIDAQLLNRIRGLNEAGLKLETIRQILPCIQGKPSGFIVCPELRAIMARELSLLDARIGELSESRTVLADYLGSIDAVGLDGQGD